MIIEKKFNKEFKRYLKNIMELNHHNIKQLEKNNFCFLMCYNPNLNKNIKKGFDLSFYKEEFKKDLFVSYKQKEIRKIQKQKGIKYFTDNHKIILNKLWNKKFKDFKIYEINHDTKPIKEKSIKELEFKKDHKVLFCNDCNNHFIDCKCKLLDIDIYPKD